MPIRSLRIPRLAALISLGTAACHLNDPPPVPAPAAELEVAAAPTTVVGTAASILEEMGWSVAPFDTLAWHLRAEHQARGDGNSDWMVCDNGVGKRGDSRRATKDLISIVAVQLQTERTAKGSQVRITANVPTAYSIFGYPERGPPEFARPRCVSSGAIEAQLGTALRNKLH